MRQLTVIVFLILSNIVFSQSWTNGMGAIHTLGSTSPSNSGTVSTTANTFGPVVSQVCFAIDSKHNCMYVADFFGNRVLRFSYPITSNLPSANLVFGQINFTNSTSGGLTQNGLNYPQGLAVDTVSGTLWVLSQAQNRVLRFDSAHAITANNPLADQVLGQPNFTSGSSSTSQNGFSFNTGPQCANLLHYDQLTGALWVSDNGNTRVLRFDNAKNLLNGAPANAVLGQSSYTTNSSGLSATQYSRPDGMTTIGSSLFVADPPNNRVLRYNNVYSKPNGGAADAVYGQTSFNTSTSGLSATALNYPTGLTSDQNTLFIAETNNSRVLIYYSANTNTVANNVLMAPNLTTAGSAAATPSTGGSNTGISYDPVSAQLLVQDRNNSRILVFQGCPQMSINSPNSVCQGNQIVLVGAGANSYTWSTNANTNSISVSPTITTVYTFTGSTSTCSSIATKTIVVNQTPTVLINSSSGTICAGSTVTLSASGANSYTWNVSSNSASVVVSPTITSSYTVTGTNTLGCESVAITAVTVTPIPNLSIVSTNSILCLGQTATLTAAGASSYSWSTGATTSTLLISPAITTTYSLTGFNSMCISTSSFIQNVASCNGIEESDLLSNKVELFPSPNNGKFTLKAETNMEVEVLNATGKVLMRENLEQGQHSIDLSAQPNGLYFIKVKTQHGVTTLKSIKH
jgi:hypothetical protein